MPRAGKWPSLRWMALLFGVLVCTNAVYVSLGGSQNWDHLMPAMLFYALGWKHSRDFLE